MFFRTSRLNIPVATVLMYGIEDRTGYLVHGEAGPVYLEKGGVGLKRRPRWSLDLSDEGSRGDEADNAHPLPAAAQERVGSVDASERNSNRLQTPCKQPAFPG